MLYFAIFGSRKSAKVIGCAVEDSIYSDQFLSRAVQGMPFNWQHDACLPLVVFNGTCNLAPFAKYVVNASEPDHVVEAIKFASKSNLRVSGKTPAMTFWRGP